MTHIEYSHFRIAILQFRNQLIRTQAPQIVHGLLSDDLLLLVKHYIFAQHRKLAVRTQHTLTDSCFLTFQRCFCSVFAIHRSLGQALGHARKDGSRAFACVHDRIHRDADDWIATANLCTFFHVHVANDARALAGDRQQSARGDQRSRYGFLSRE
ncbi:hypothetical protein XJ27_12590 [Xanthomonas hortorum]|nr:hypothetical protein XJ27_12590 [Xanthomonas hortorum]